MTSSRVWFDVLTPKQVLLFSPVIGELTKRGSQVLATSREYREIPGMAQLCGLDLKFVGERGGADISDQLTASTKRELEMIPTIKSFGPSVAVSVASSVCARVAFGLRVKHIAVNDSPHSAVAGRLSLPLSYRLLCPWVIPYAAWEKFGIFRPQVTRYHALDPAAWLKRPPLRGPIPALPQDRKTITIRLEEGYAPYMQGTDKSLTGAVLAGLSKAYPDANLVALCRYGDQLKAVEREFGSKFIIPSGTVDGRRLLEATDLFIGMGGTMTAEAALIGIPTVSAFQGTLYTEVYLESVGLVSKARGPKSIFQLANRLLKPEVKASRARRAKRILDSMEDPVPRIVDAIEATARNL
jgi:predicted glycosyltransferase